jgi:hypothetical protein
MDGTEHLTCMGKIRNLHNVLAGKSKKKPKIAISMVKVTKLWNGFTELCSLEHSKQNSSLSTNRKIFSLHEQLVNSEGGALKTYWGFRRNIDVNNIR